MAPRRQGATDRLIRSRLRETVSFPDLTEHRTLRLASIQHYTARAHFAPWHRVLGTPDFAGWTGLFSPLVYVELEVFEAASMRPVPAWCIGSRASGERDIAAPPGSPATRR